MINHMNIRLVTFFFSCLFFSGCAVNQDSTATRGIGKYPGRWTESGAPSMVSGGRTYRNLALNRQTLQSSSYDYNLTSQLATDGIIDEGAAPWLEVIVDDMPVCRAEREFLIDGRASTKLSVSDGGSLQLTFHGMPFVSDCVELKGTSEGKPLTGKDIIVEHEDDSYIFSFPGKKDVSVHTVDFYREGSLLDVLPSLFFHSAWKSATGENEWISVDLGAVSSFDRIVFHWQNAPVSGQIQISDDAQSWTVMTNLNGSEINEEAKARYIRVLLDRTADGHPFELKEWEIYGRGGLVAEARPAPARVGVRQDLTCGNWKLIRSSLVCEDGETLSVVGYDDSFWLPATVPGTVLTSYVEIGAVHEPGFSDNQFSVSESFFRSDFWYRNTFESNPDTDRQSIHLCGVNWKAEVYMNGAYLGLVDGAYREGDFDVTGLLKKGENCLAVRVICNEHFGAVTEQNALSSGHNGGILGADNPTVHASIGWDWVPTVRGRNSGIIDDVYLNYTGPVTVESPFVRTEIPLPDTTYADILSEVTLVNHSSKQVKGVLTGSYGDLTFELPQTLDVGENRLVKLDTLRMRNPKLWWPNGYGEQHLYDVSFAFEIDGIVSDIKEFKSGVRQIDARIDTVSPDRNGDTRCLNLYVNGKRFVAFGGNWGLPEQMLRYRGREYDIAVSNHAHQNFTMIRNWVGQIYDHEFYESCDRYGILVWQDFWLANPADGPEPYYVDRFNATAKETVLRIRNHPCIGIYVGRNEGYPPEEIENYLSEMVERTHPGIYYLSSSADGPVSGRGPYRAMPPEEYFTMFGLDKLHSERGMPDVMNYENMLRTFGPEGLDPVNTMDHQNPLYGLHDYTLGNIPNVSSAQRTDLFNQILAKAFGEPSDSKQFAEWSQWVNYDGYRAIFESRSAHRQGMLLWMSHPAWPSLVWQTYDYYLEPTSGYFACRKACEPLHIQWNPVTGNVEAVSWYSSTACGLTVRAEIVDVEGKSLWGNSCNLDLGEDQTAICFHLEYPETLPEVYFIRLRLDDADGNEISENIYWQGREKGNLKALLSAPETTVAVETRTVATETGYELKVALENRGETVAMMLRAKVVDSTTDDLILPARYSDNYIFLMPGETRAITASVSREDCVGNPVVNISGFNVSKE